MSVKPSYLDPKYDGLSSNERERQYSRDKMIWEQTEALKEANRLKDEQLHGKPEYHNPLADYQRNIDNIIEKDEYEEIYGEDYEEEYEETEEDKLVNQECDLKDKYAKLSLQKDNLKNLAESERSEIGMELSLLIGIIVACITGPLYDGNFMLYGFGAFGGTYIVVNLIHLWLKSLAKKKIEFIKSKQKEMRQKIKDVQHQLDELDKRAMKENKKSK